MLRLQPVGQVVEARDVVTLEPAFFRRLADMTADRNECGILSVIQRQMLAPYGGEAERFLSRLLLANARSSSAMFSASLALRLASIFFAALRSTPARASSLILPRCTPNLSSMWLRQSVRSQGGNKSP